MVLSHCLSRLHDDTEDEETIAADAALEVDAPD